ncbi:FkbM family methyltransferase [Ectopseudomonas mendocina]|uniref:FkbM family methyltransferase n=1 Tax=Ectopseudomonas mendocina TaxID=300 RepID=UPI001AE05C1F|nr:FkbM family methyltransferase [Pseudomonas mendocina]QTN45092.1 FkbM family methyltransferase [Pseudomonas mendocina]
MIAGLEGKNVSTFLLNGVKISFLVDNSKDVIQWSHDHGEFYEQDELKDISLVIPTRANILDIGSNVGNHLVYFAKFCRNVRVTPFEVNPAALEMLKVNIALNAVEGQVNEKYLGMALGQFKGYVTLINGDKIANNLGAASFCVTNDPQGLVMMPLDALSLEFKPDFIKIDVEGMEIAVLRGGERTIVDARPPLYVEVAPKNREEFKNILRDWGYSIERTHQRHRGVVNYLCVPW